MCVCVYAMVDISAGPMEKKGYVLDIKFVLHDAKVNEYNQVHQNILWDINVGYHELSYT